jgi:hypothetical protein
MDETKSIGCDEVSDDAFTDLKTSGRYWGKFPIDPVVWLDSPSAPDQLVMNALACEKKILKHILIVGTNFYACYKYILRWFQILPCMVNANIKKATTNLDYKSVNKTKICFSLRAEKNGQTIPTNLECIDFIDCLRF